MPLFRYVCPAGHEQELLRSRDVVTAPCACGQTAERDSVYHIGFSGFGHTPRGQGDFREDYRRFREASEGLADKAERIERDENISIPSPLFQAAKARAADLAAKGVTADDIST